MTKSIVRSRSNASITPNYVEVAPKEPLIANFNVRATLGLRPVWKFHLNLLAPNREEDQDILMRHRREHPLTCPVHNWGLPFDGSVDIRLFTQRFDFDFSILHELQGWSDSNSPSIDARLLFDDAVNQFGTLHIVRRDDHVIAELRFADLVDQAIIPPGIVEEWFRPV